VYTNRRARAKCQAPRVCPLKKRLLLDLEYKSLNAPFPFPNQHRPSTPFHQPPPASMEETRLYHEDVAATERFFRNPRFAQTARPYSAQVSS